MLPCSLKMTTRRPHSEEGKREECLKFQLEQAHARLLKCEQQRQATEVYIKKLETRLSTGCRGTSLLKVVRLQVWCVFATCTTLLGGLLPGTGYAHGIGSGI